MAISPMIYSQRTGQSDQSLSLENLCRGQYMKIAIFGRQSPNAPWLSECLCRLQLCTRVSEKVLRLCMGPKMGLTEVQEWPIAEKEG